MMPCKSVGQLVLATIGIPIDGDARHRNGFDHLWKRLRWALIRCKLVNRVESQLSRDLPNGLSWGVARDGIKV